MLNEETKNRYSRQELIDWWDQDQLKNGRVMVAGAGAIGNEVIKLLALTGVGHILIVDFDRIEFSNLTRSVLFREGDVGRAKAEVAAERARELNPEIDIRYLQGDLEFEVGLGIYRDMDVVIGCLDSLQARLAVNRACIKVGTPWLNGGIEATHAEISLIADAACFECGMSDEMWESRNRRYSCAGLRSENNEAKVPTTAVIASLAAGYLVNETLLLLHADSMNEKSGMQSGQKLTFQLKPYHFSIYDQPRNPDCLAHEHWNSIQNMAVSPRDLSVNDLLEKSKIADGVMELGFDLIWNRRCISCGYYEETFKPLEKCDVSLLECPSCGSPDCQPEILNWIDSQHPLSQRMLSELSIPDFQIVSIKNETERRYFQLGGEFWNHNQQNEEPINSALKGKL